MSCPGQYTHTNMQYQLKCDTPLGIWISIGPTLVMWYRGVHLWVYRVLWTVQYHHLQSIFCLWYPEPFSYHYLKPPEHYFWTQIERFPLSNIVYWVLHPKSMYWNALCAREKVVNGVNVMGLEQVNITLHAVKTVLIILFVSSYI